MPNHFVTVGFCRIDGDRIVDDDYKQAEKKLEELNDSNLCKLVLPMPEVFKDIHYTGDGPGRRRWKSTGLFAGVGSDRYFGKFDELDWLPLSRQESEQLKKEHGADNWYDWSNLHYGTQSGTYGTKARMLDGDGFPVIIEFQSAWSPPLPDMLKKIEDYLDREYLLCDFHWLGHCPGQSRIMVLSVPQP